MLTVQCGTSWRAPNSYISKHQMKPTDSIHPGEASIHPREVVALFNASDDTVEMVKRMLGASGFTCLVGCHFSDLRNGVINFDRYLADRKPDVVIFDISPPYRENWDFFKTLRDSKAMEGRGLVLTTTNKNRLDETVGKDSEAFEIVGKPYDLDQIKNAIYAALKETREAQRPRQ
jgi:DNA-binding response OmpR family regulator